MKKHNLLKSIANVLYEMDGNRNETLQNYTCYKRNWAYSTCPGHNSKFYTDENAEKTSLKNPLSVGLHFQGLAVESVLNIWSPNWISIHICSFLLPQKTNQTLERCSENICCFLHTFGNKLGGAEQWPCTDHHRNGFLLGKELCPRILRAEIPLKFNSTLRNPSWNI